MTANPNCRLCSLGGQFHSTCVPGRVIGEWPTRGAKVLVLGEALGEQEDLQGQPFMGESGRLMNEAFAETGLTDLIITNVVRCRSHGRPTKEQISACATYLDEEIAAFQPTHILALGKTALLRLVGGSESITKAAGVERHSERYHCVVYPVFHPAYILRDPGRKKAWLADIHRFAHIVKGTNVKTPPVTPVVVSEPDQLLRLIDTINTRQPMTYDFEAAMLPWWHKDWFVKSISFSFSGTVGYTLPLRRYSDEWLRRFGRLVQRTMQDPAVPKTAHNQLYDDPVWRRVFGYFPFGTFDTMMAAQVLDENRPKGLEWLLGAILGWPQYKGDYNAKSDDEMDIVGAIDAAGTFLLRQHLLAELRAQPRLLAYFGHLVMPMLRALERLTWTGVYIDEQTVLREQEYFTREISHAMAALPEGLNPKSPQQVADWVYGELKAHIRHLTPTGAPSTDIVALREIAHQYPQVKPIVTVRHAEKMLGTYIEKDWKLSQTSFDGRAHFDYRPASVETLRLASPFHTHPRESRVRHIVSARPGWTFVSADYSNLEARLVAWDAVGAPAAWEQIAHIPNCMLQAFRMGRDIYLDMAGAALNKPREEVTREGGDSERQVFGKVPTLASLYKITPKGLQAYAYLQEIIWSFEQASHLLKTFYDLWPEIPAWHQRMETHIRAKGYTENVIGWVRHLPGAQSDNWKIYMEAVKQGINARIQNLASNITQMALVTLTDELDPEEAVIVGDVHDSLEFEVRDDCLEKVLPMIRRGMLEAPDRLSVLGLHLPPGLIKLEILLGPWGDKENVKWEPSPESPATPELILQALS